MKGNIAISILTIFLLFVSCQKEEIAENSANSDLLYVSVSANALTPPEVDRNDTRAVIRTENSIEELQIILFDENDKFLDVYTPTVDKVSIPHSTEKRSLYVVANATSTVTNAKTNWQSGVTSIDDIIESLYQERASNEMPQMPFAMYAKLVFNDGINNNSAITNDGTNNGTPLLLKRNVAKISLSVSEDLSDFTIKRLMLCEAPTSGYLIKNTIRDLNVDNYELIDAAQPLYSYVATQTTTIILEAETENGTRYFKIVIKESEAHGAIGLKQNNWYKIVILSKSGIGYATLEDAINGRVFDHIEIALEVLDITMYDFVFGKDFFIATSNSNYEQYGHRIGDNYYEICKIRFANNLTNDDILGNTKIEIVSGDIIIDPNTVSEIATARNHQTYSIMAKFTQSSVNGKIRVTYNNVSKNIFVKVEPQQDLRYDQFIELPFSVLGSIYTPNIPWCGINDEKVFVHNDYYDSNANNGTILYLTVQNNPNLFESREVEAHFARTKTGMSKVMVCQNPDNNLIYLGENGKLCVGNASKATYDKVMFFKYGSVIGVNNHINGNEWDNSYIKFNPSNYIIGQDITEYEYKMSFELPGIPCYNDDDLSKKLSLSDKVYHNATNIRKGKGDPCILVGLTAEQIKSMSDEDLNNYVSGYRMPTNAEQLSFSGLPGNDNNYTLHWWNEKSTNNPLPGIRGGEFPKRNGFLGYFLPAHGYIEPAGTRYLQDISGYYWTNHVGRFGNPFCLEFNNKQVNPANGDGYFPEGMPIRCVRIR